MPRIAVIGAGCSGITAVKTLVEQGLTDLVCYEKQDQIGGNWVYTGSPGHSSVCETTHIISSKTLSQYSDFPMPADYPDYPSHRQVLAYFQAYTDHFDLLPYIQFNTGVEKVLQQADGTWLLRLSDGSQEQFDHVLVANGHHSSPRHPAWRTDFTGQYLHSHDYKNNQGLEGKSILVVGAGNSGCDCAVESSRVAASVDISVRSPQYIIPKFFMGRPTDTFAENLQWLPKAVQNLLHRLTVRIQVGQYSDYGLPEPTFPPTKSHPTVNSELLDKIRHGKVRPRPGIQKVEGNTVVFTDGSSQQYDTIIAATGYKTRFPFFDADFLQWEDATNIPLYLRVFHPEYEGLYFIGLVQPQGCVWPLSEAQSRQVGKIISGALKLPTHWKTQAREEGDRIERSFVLNPRHAVEVHYHPYLRQLRRAAQKV